MLGEFEYWGSKLAICLLDCELFDALVVTVMNIHVLEGGLFFAGNNKYRF